MCARWHRGYAYAVAVKVTSSIAISAKHICRKKFRFIVIVCYYII